MHNLRDSFGLFESFEGLDLFATFHGRMKRKTLRNEVTLDHASLRNPGFFNQGFLARHFYAV